jgi:hypothetical protein
MTPRQRIARTSQWVALPLAIALGALLFATRGTPFGMALAGVLCVLALPWVVAALIAIAVLSSPIYMALHPLALAPALDTWLGGQVLLAIAAGVQINAGLLLAWWRRPRTAPEVGLGEFLRRTDVCREPTSI